MVEADLLIGHLRSQARELQSLLSYLENREGLRAEDYTYSQSKLCQLIRQLKELAQFSARHASAQQLQAHWLN